MNVKPLKWHIDSSVNKPTRYKAAAYQGMYVVEKFSEDYVTILYYIDPIYSERIVSEKLIGKYANKEGAKLHAEDHYTKVLASLIEMSD